MFTYSGPTGPEYWGNLSNDYVPCKNGAVQSPVNIEKDEAVLNSTLNPLNRKYSSSVNSTLINSCYHIGVKFEDQSGAGVLNVDGKDYTLIKLHWHTPSEHQIDGYQFPAELHLVHQAADATLSVVSILYNYTSDDDSVDPFLAEQIEEQLVELPNVSCGGKGARLPLGNLDLTELGNQAKNYYRYVGSLTTPGCTETVIWTVLQKVRSISQDQVEALRNPLNGSYKENARPTQPLHDRKVQVSDSDNEDDDDDGDNDDDDGDD
ncbi:hypothetical protein L484_015379 [Morus notabilis]|uniref:Carbonic anhydrase n=2 Tax=Morus notabilis TaxID=981085 RepID=W9RG31_9ROSA|nr:hypothetical protein L484_015379 [Morus notabilis]